MSRVPAKRALVRLGDETQWNASYDTCTVLHVDVQRMPNGQWRAASAHAQFARVHHVVARFEGRAFYMGEFKCVHRRSVNVAAFERLWREMQDAVLARVDANPATRSESTTMLRNGGVPLTRLTLRRVGYDERFQAALLKVHAKLGPSVRDEDVEDFEEDCDEDKE